MQQIDRGEILKENPEFQYARDEDLVFIGKDERTIPCASIARLVISVIRYTSDDILMNSDLIDDARKSILMSELIVSNLAVVSLLGKGQQLMSEGEIDLVREIVEQCAAVLIEVEPVIH